MPVICFCHNIPSAGGEGILFVWQGIYIHVSFFLLYILQISFLCHLDLNMEYLLVMQNRNKVGRAYLNFDNYSIAINNTI